MVGIDGSLLSWTHDYLITRRQRLRDPFPDAWLPVTFGGKGLFYDNLTSQGQSQLFQTGTAMRCEQARGAGGMLPQENFSNQAL